MDLSPSVTSPSALTFYRMEQVDRRDASTWSEVQHAIERVDGWRKTYRQQKLELHTLSTARTLEADEGRTEQEVQSVLTDQDIWNDFDDLVQAIQDGECIESSDLTLTTAATGAVLLFESCQRPGAVTGATLDEFSVIKTSG